MDVYSNSNNCNKCFRTNIFSIIAYLLQKIFSTYILSSLTNVYDYYHILTKKTKINFHFSHSSLSTKIFLKNLAKMEETALTYRQNIALAGRR